MIHLILLVAYPIVLLLNTGPENNWDGNPHLEKD